VSKCNGIVWPMSLTIETKHERLDFELLAQRVDGGERDDPVKLTLSSRAGE
jgi:hypothetical protein